MVATRKKTSVFLQMEATECGAAALGIVAAYYKLFKPLEELRQLCGISRNGSKASNIMLAAERLGFRVLAYTYTSEEIKKVIPPVILHWEFNHFLVYEGYDEKTGKVYLNDPANGHRCVEWDQFEISYTGVCIVVRPGEDFQPGGSTPSMWRYLTRDLKQDKRTMGFIISIALLLAIVGLMLPVVFQVFFDEVFSYRHREWLFDVLLAVAIGIVIKGTLVFLRAWCLTRWQGNLVIGKSSAFLLHVLKLPIEFFQQRYVGEIASRVQFNESVSSFATGNLATVAIDVVVALFYLILLFFYDVKLTIIGVSFTIVNITIVYYTFRWFAEQQQKIQQISGSVYGLSIAGLATIDTLKANGNESDFFLKWSGQQAKLLGMTQKMEYYSMYIALVPSLLAGLNSALVMAVGGFKIMDGFMTLGIFIAFQNLMANFQSPINKIVNMLQQIQQMKSQMMKLEDVHAYPIDEFHFPTEADPIENKRRLSGSLELRGINFGYCRLENPLIKKFNLKIEPGRRVAVVGESGCGKSTLAKIVAGLYQPWSGMVLFDGVEHANIPRAVRANSVALVEQEIVLFEGTVAENIALFDTSMSRKEIIQAAKDACIHRDISMLNQAYDSKVEEGGVNFSGGQRQRIEIARALAMNPALVIFDEATSALDPVTEKQIMMNIRRRGCSCLIIAHRLSTIRDCDEIIVLHKGRVVQRGTHETMAAVEGPYRRLMADEG